MVICLVNTLELLLLDSSILCYRRWLSGLDTTSLWLYSLLGSIVCVYEGWWELVISRVRLVMGFSEVDARVGLLYFLEKVLKRLFLSIFL